MNKNMKAFTESTVVYGFIGAIFFAAVFALLGFSENIRSDLLFGTFTGAVVGLLIAIAVGIIERQFMCPSSGTDNVAWTVCDALVGLLVGAIISTFVVIIAVHLIGYITQPAGTAVWGVLLGRLIGFPLGGILGLAVGVSWHWLQLRLSGPDHHAPV